jgi:hypothetical protein
MRLWSECELPGRLRSHVEVGSSAERRGRGRARVVGTGAAELKPWSQRTFRIGGYLFYWENLTSSVLRLRIFTVKIIYFLKYRSPQADSPPQPPKQKSPPARTFRHNHQSKKVRLRGLSATTTKVKKSACANSPPQPSKQISLRWRTLCHTKESLRWRTLRSARLRKANEETHTRMVDG